MVAEKEKEKKRNKLLTSFCFGHKLKADFRLKGGV